MRKKLVLAAIALLTEYGLSFDESSHKSILIALCKYRGVSSSFVQGLTEPRARNRICSWLRKRKDWDKGKKTKTIRKKHKLVNFYTSWEWTTLRLRVLLHYGRKCMCCGQTPEDGASIQVDHILPKSKHPELALRFDNLQVLCLQCNRGKGAWDTTDFRPNAA